VFRNVVQKRDGDQLERSMKNEEAIYTVKKEKNILRTKKKKEGYLDWSHLA
jgi:hypothetical protein